MKKHLKSIAACAMLVAVLVSCKKKDDPAPSTGGSTDKVVVGNITSDQTWKVSDNIQLGGYVYVKSGATLTIEAGSTIKSSTIQSALIVEPGAKIMAVGTASSPIVFTSGNSNPRRGDWAGIVLCGKAMTNNYGSTAPIIEGGLATTYGSPSTESASVNADNSGTLSYVRIEYAGYAPIPGSELNGLSMYALGSGTTISHVQVTAANDDSFEWFGGAVNCDHLIAYMGIDDDFDTDNGFSGHVQFGLGVRSRYVADQSGSKGFESDHDGSANTNDPHTLCKFSNMTIVGPVNSMGNISTSVAPNAVAATYIAGMHTRRNSSISVVNSIIMGWPTGILIDSKTGSSGVTCANYVDGTGMIKNNLIAGISKNFKANATALQPGTDIMVYDAVSVVNGSGDLTAVNATTIKDSTTLTWPSYATGPRTFVYNAANGNRYQYEHSGILVNPFSEANPSAYDFRLAASSPAASGADFTGLPSDFTTVSYIGAFSTTDWTAGWANFPQTNNQ
ncbi:MAG: IPT/TIG domain-containing protein [Cytophaga sp.]|uniref:IPT/TIG domain-containing protein n=1 Tax=Cytophaga sp. TaxID=29535 RepID=UPI003F7D1008